MSGPAQPAPPDAASGILAFLFTDLAGSTRLWEQVPDAMSAALRRHDAILGEAIAASGGHVVKTTGDGVMAVFPRAADGVAASIDAQRALAREAWRETGPLRVRMGLHAGEAERRGDDYFGPTVNRTARIMSAGHGGQVLLSSTAAALVADRLPSGATLRDLGEQRLKDIGRPERVFQLVHPDLEASFPSLVTSDLAHAGLPIQAAAFVGRRTELAAIGARLADPAVRLLTLTGPGGTGKTSLAVRAAGDQAGRFRDGVAFVDLSASRDTDDALTALGRAIGVGEVADRPHLEELGDRLRTSQLLLVLDNFEQVTEAAGAVSTLLAVCPELTLLVTSREALHLRAEHLYPVPPLGVPPSGDRVATAELVARFEAVELFVERAREVRPEFELTDENAAAVAEICRRLDGLPLAIELAAARLRLFSAQALRDRLGNRLDLLRGASRDLPERQQALRATIDWSFALLEPGEQRLFELLSVFADADAVAIEGVAALAADGSADVLDHLASLLEKSLVRQLEAPHGEPRVGLLETIREYASERLDGDPGQAGRARRAHATWYAELAARRQSDLVGPGREDAVHALSEEVGNLRVAWRYWVGEADLDQLNRLATSLLVLNEARGWYLDTVVMATDLLAVLESAAPSPEHVGQEVALRTTLARALMATRGYTPEVEEAYTRALELFEGGDHGASQRQHFTVLRALANIYMLRTEFDKASGLGEQILELAEREHDPAMLVDGHLVVGATLVFGTDLRGGLRHLDLAIDAFASGPARPVGFRLGNDPRVACYTTSGFGLWLAGFPDTARERMGAAVAMAAELDHPFTSAFAQFHAGLLNLWLGAPALVMERAVALLDIADEHDLAIWSAVGTCLLGAAQTGLGRGEAGLAAVRSGMALYGGLRTPPVFWPMLLFVEATAALHAGHPADGLAPIGQAIELMGGDLGSVMVPELRLLEGDLLAALPAGDPGGRGSPGVSYRRAFDRATDLGTRMSQLRAAVRLCGIVDGGRPRAEAVAALAAVLDTFTEGFETADLVEARRLLGPAGGS